ncbi:MAG: hypothetical protein JNL67_02740 [Planctomycetaceae bacterium]|nr:hypothetical protein [Planctomycetaceae bacterium]
MAQSCFNGRDLGILRMLAGAPARVETKLMLFRATINLRNTPETTTVNPNPMRENTPRAFGPRGQPYVSLGQSSRKQIFTGTDTTPNVPSAQGASRMLA